MLRIICLSMFLGFAFLSAAGQSATPAAEINTDQVVHVLCGKKVALLGESPVHGFGKTLEFKVELVRRLVDECHYNALFMESGIYDYINIQKKFKSGQEVTEPMISAAIGGLWATKEMQPLIPFLREKVKAGSLTLGGLDDQLERGTYAQREMPSGLVQHLQGHEQARCLAILQKHTLWQYPDDAPYSQADRTRIVGCLNQIEARLSQPEASRTPWAEEDRVMIESLKRSLSRDFIESQPAKSDQELKWVNDRERSMYLNFQWLLSRLPTNTKIIVWAATVHTAKALSSVSGFEGRVPLGSYIRHDLGDRAYSLGFSAYAGNYEFLHPPVHELSTAPTPSLEGQVFAHGDSDAVFLSRKQLRNYGLVAARPLGISFTTAHWDQVIDGLIVFQEERPPEWLHR